MEINVANCAYMY